MFIKKKKERERGNSKSRQREIIKDKIEESFPKMAKDKFSD